MSSYLQQLSKAGRIAVACFRDGAAVSSNCKLGWHSKGAVVTHIYSLVCPPPPVLYQLAKADKIAVAYVCDGAFSHV